MSFARNIVMLFPLLLILSTGASAVSSRVDSLKQKIASVHAKIDSLSSVEGEIVAQLDATERNISLLNMLIEALRSEADSIANSIAVLSDSADRQKAQWQFQQTELANTLREMYIAGNADNWQLLLKSQDAEKLAENIVYFGSIADARNKRISQAQKIWKKYSTTISALNRKQDSLKIVLAIRDAARDSLLTVKENHRRRINSIRKNKDAFEKIVHQLESSLHRIEEQLSEKHIAGHIFERKKGHLPCPVQDGCVIIRRFGTIKDERYGTYFSNPGIDISCRAGENVIAVADGTVADVVWLTGYQNVVIVQHTGGYYTIYGNLETTLVKKGDKVAVGKPIGKVSAQSWLGEKPALHFEIRHGKKKQNPAMWLQNTSAMLRNDEQLMPSNLVYT